MPTMEEIEQAFRDNHAAEDARIAERRLEVNDREIAVKAREDAVTERERVIASLEDEVKKYADTRAALAEERSKCAADYQAAADQLRQAFEAKEAERAAAVTARIEELNAQNVKRDEEVAEAQARLREKESTLDSEILKYRDAERQLTLRLAEVRGE